MSGPSSASDTPITDLRQLVEVLASGEKPREAWRIFAANQHLFRGTPTSIWMNHVFGTIMGFDVALDADTSDMYFDRIGELLASEAYRPRALFERFNIELLATTESPTDSLEHHQAIKASGWKGRVVTAYRPDAVVDPDFPGFHDNLDRLGEITGCDTGSWAGYLDAHRARRAYFKSFGATSTDHGHADARGALSDPRSDPRRRPAAATTC